MKDIKALPKVELHVHLDGSLNPVSVASILNIPVSQATNNMVAPSKCIDLNDYLTKFDLCIEAMQEYDNIVLLTKEFVKTLEEDNVIYTEVRFAPMKHISKISPDKVIEAVLEGIKNDKIIINLILCMMRGDNLENNKKVIDLAKKYINKGVVAIDLAGAEGLFKTSDYKDLFKYAKDLNIPFTIHAGEADGINSIKSAIQFGSKRIGHGIRAVEDINLLEEIKLKKILLEICPTSNIQTNVTSNIFTHPIRKIFDFGCLVSVNTDNRTVSNTSLNKEYKLLMDNLNFSIDDLIKINEYSIMNSFADYDTKLYILNKIKNYRKD